jgi:hypothetical protein
MPVFIFPNSLYVLSLSSSSQWLFIYLSYFLIYIVWENVVLVKKLDLMILMDSHSLSPHEHETVVFGMPALCLYVIAPCLCLNGWTDFIRIRFQHYIVWATDPSVLLSKP